MVSTTAQSTRVFYLPYGGVNENYIELVARFTSFLFVVLGDKTNLVKLKLKYLVHFHNQVGTYFQPEELTALLSDKYNRVCSTLEIIEIGKCINFILQTSIIRTNIFFNS